MFFVLIILGNITKINVIKVKKYIILDLESCDMNKESIDDLFGINLKGKITVTVNF